MIQYSKETTLTRLNEALVEPSTLYNSTCVNWSGVTSDTKESYSEVLSAEILKNLDSFVNGIAGIARNASYSTTTHTGFTTTGRDEESSNRSEEHIVLKLFRDQATFKSIGKILDYQIPLKNTCENKAGKIDLLSINTESNTAYILEIKAPMNNDTLLHAVLEAFTYSRIVDSNKMLSDYSISGVTLCPAVLLYLNSQAHKDAINTAMVNTHELVKTLGVSIFTFNDTTNEIDQVS